MKKKNTKTSDFPGMKLNKSLNKYSNMNLFPEKLEEANRTLKRLGLPKKDDKKP
jgi:hypothetical protein